MRASGSNFISFSFSFLGTVSTITDAEGVAGAVRARVAQNLGRLEHSTSDLEVVLVLRYLLSWYQSTGFISESWTT
jgi:hypothetical protein